MRVLVACEFSGVVREAFRRRGHDAWSLDRLPAEDGSKFHYQVDLDIDVLADEFLHLNRHGYWDLIIAHPPCTFLSNSGVKHLYREGRKENGKDIYRWLEMQAAVRFFRMFLRARADRICVENPVMHGHAKSLLGMGQTQLIQPWMFGHLESKATCLWLRGLPELVPTCDVKKQMLALPLSQRTRVHYASPGPDRWKERSRTLVGIAHAMAEQWG